MLLLAALVAPLAGVAALLRFFRWQYLLRCFQVRLPTRGSLGTFLASTPGWLTPFALGEGALRAFLGARDGANAGRVALLWGADRALDFSGLTLLLALLPGGGISVLQVGVGVLLVAVVWTLASGANGAWTDGGRRPERVSHTLWLVTGSAVAWTPLVLACAVGGWLMGDGVGWGPGAVTLRHSIARLIPAVPFSFGSGLPAGIRAALGVVGSTWAVLSVVAIGRAFRRRQGAPAEHFDAIAARYLDQFSAHIWELLLARRVGYLTAALEPVRQGTGLDVGCGMGRQLAAMRERGFAVVGLDPARSLLAVGGSAGRQVAVAGSALDLPFRNAGLAFAYAVGVVHHLPGRRAQAAAVTAIQAALRPGGRLVVQETNPVNPVFRFYMGYIFPLTREIDEGTEWWIWPGAWRDAPGYRVVEVRHFTFLPDFLPQRVLRHLLGLERWLERSAFRAWSVHYQVVLERLPDSQGART